MDASMKRALKEYISHGGALKQHGSWGPSAELSRTRRQLGPHADHLLSKSSAALEAYRGAPRGRRVGASSTNASPTASTQELSEQQEGGSGEAKNFFSGVSSGQQEEWANSWHPGRMQTARGSGKSLLRSRRTQEALRELRAHTASRQQPQPEHLELEADKGGQGSPQLLATSLATHAGFTKVQSKGQALEAIKDLLTERLGKNGRMSRARTEDLSTERGLKVQRAKLEGLVHNIGRTEADMADIKAAERGQRSDEQADLSRGRTIGEGYRSVEDKIGALRRALADKEDSVRHDKTEVRRLRSLANMERKAALTADREEVSRYGRADMAKGRATTYAHKLLAEKSRAKHLEEKAKHEEARADAYEKEGESLKEESKREETQFESMAGPVKKAQNAVSFANSAYNAAEMKLAAAESAVPALGKAHPKQLKAAMATIAKDRELALKMSELVEESTRRMNDLSNRSGPLTGLDSHFEGPKERAVRKLATARRISGKLAATRQREIVLKEDVRGELPQLKSEIARAKRLHQSYEEAHRRAEAAEKRAREVGGRYAEAERALRGDVEASKEMEDTLRKAERGVGDRLKESYESDWRRLKRMHGELAADKQEYEKARERSCGAGGPCPVAAKSGMPTH